MIPVLRDIFKVSVKGCDIIINVKGENGLPEEYNNMERPSQVCLYPDGEFLSELQKPYIIEFLGVSGTGKSTVARGLTKAGNPIPLCTHVDELALPGNAELTESLEEVRRRFDKNGPEILLAQALTEEIKLRSAEDLIYNILTGRFYPGYEIIIIERGPNDILALSPWIIAQINAYDRLFYEDMEERIFLSELRQMADSRFLRAYQLRRNICATIFFDGGYRLSDPQRSVNSLEILQGRRRNEGLFTHGTMTNNYSYPSIGRGYSHWLQNYIYPLSGLLQVDGIDVSIQDNSRRVRDYILGIQNMKKLQ